MLDSALIKQLSHPDPERRKLAIRALAQTQNRAALPYLAEVHQTDKNAEIRELARKAGIYINKQNSPQNSRIHIQPDDTPDDARQSPAPTKEKHDAQKKMPSALDRERAEGLVRQALNIHMRGDNDRAIKYLRQAIAKDPALAHDSYTRGLAATITGLPPSDAIDGLLAGIEEQKPKHGEPQKRNADQPKWSITLLHLSGYFVIITGALVAAYTLFTDAVTARTIQDMLRTALKWIPSFPYQPHYDGIITTLMHLEPLILGAVSAGLAFIATIFLWIQCNSFHFIAQNILSGEGTRRRLVTKIAIPMALTQVVYAAVLVVVAQLAVETFSELRITILNNQQVIWSGFPSNGQLVVLVAALLIPTLIHLLLIGERVGNAYRFGIWFGALTLVVYLIFSFVMATVTTFIIGVLVSQFVDPSQLPALF